MLRKAVEREQLRQIAFQSPHRGTIRALPATAEISKSGFRQAATLGSIDGLGILLDRIMIALAYLLQNVPHLVHPTTLMAHPGIDGADGRARPAQPSVRISSSDRPFESPSVEILQQPLPIPLAFALAAQKASNCRLPPFRIPQATSICTCLRPLGRVRRVATFLSRLSHSRHSRLG